LITKTTIPATLYSPQFDAGRCGSEALKALAIGEGVRRICTGVESWVTFPLANRTGDSLDFRIGPYSGRAKWTAFAEQMPYIMEIVGSLIDSGVNLRYARIAILFERDVLRPHIDMCKTTRLLIPLNDQGNDFRHVFGEFCVAMRAGDLWGVRGDLAHGAANVSARGRRVMLMLDADRRFRFRPEWANAPWHIPEDRLVVRYKWNPETRNACYARAKRVASEYGAVEAERQWLFVPFEYQMAADQVYGELLEFCRMMARDASQPEVRLYWLRRSERLCNPSLRCDVRPPVIKRTRC
jgi:hypothetical protein